MKVLNFTETVLNFTKKIARCMSSPKNYDLSDPVERRFAALYVLLIDHGIIRFIWTNQARIADGAWRSNHPTHRRLRNLANSGFKTIISLRGDLKNAPHRCEAETCATLGMALVNVPMAARSAPEVKTLLKLITVLGKVERPFLIHCKSGADRTGIASAVYLMTYCGTKPSEAKKQLSLQFLHFQKSSSGILDHVLNTYAERLASGPISFLDWVSQEYDPKAVSASFAPLQNRNRTAQSFR
jgi:protein tyrosine phosphatase (PTP) superfamily phosphohydrolase (DUF442 family)